ncbi:MAG TPA: peptidase M22 [Opitutaceae bacterium]|jgi:tRNA threonylcarbamoyladenosine biosynthesis protein TsaB
MPSLGQLLESHSPLLLIDAASARIQAGVLAAGRAPRWASRAAEAGTGIFDCLDDLGFDVNSAAAFIFCEGPGSILGVRTAAMALRIWSVMSPRPIFGYRSLALAAEAAPEGAAVIADARRGLWHRAVRGMPLALAAPADLSGALVSPEGFRSWDPLPPGTKSMPYDVAAVLAKPAAAAADIFRQTDAPDAFLHREPEYARWTPRIHRAP